ncbi:MAG: peptidylprolyl isomerase [Bacteroidota bacterium]
MRFTKIFLLSISLLITLSISAQENKKPVIDEVIAIVGNKSVLLSDIENQYLQYRMQSQGADIDPNVRCIILENILFSKLLITQAQLDSVEITDPQVEERIERNMRYFISQFGTKQKLEEFYKKTISEIKEELRENVKDQLFVEFMQDKITRGINITPTEIKTYFKKIPADSIPMVSSEFEILEISKTPKVSPEQENEVKTKLNEFRNRVLAGEDFATLAVLYSEDPGSAIKGGELGFVNRGELYPEFETAAFALKTGEISPIIKTKAGFHIIQLIERRGQAINVRHILINPKPSIDEMTMAKVTLDSVYTLLQNKTITFDEAVVKYSSAPNKNSGGNIVNPYTGATFFSETQIDETLKNSIEKLIVGEFSTPILSKNDDGETCFRIIKLKSKTTPHRANMVEDYDKVQKAALEDKKQRTLNLWVAGKIKDIYVKISPDYKKCLFTHPWFKD